MKELTKQEQYKLYRSWSAPKRNRAVRTIKMVKPVCKQCQFPLRDKWFLECEHEPYMEETTQEVHEPKFEIDEAGDTVVTEVVTKLKVQKTPHFAQVALSDNINSGQGVVKARAKGFKLPSELGLPEFCQYRDCWEPEPTIRTDHGTFCSKQQARLIAARATGMILEVFVPNKRKQQLEGINVG